MWAQGHLPEGGRANAGCLAALALCAVILWMLAGPPGFAAQGAPNAVANGSLTQGSGNAPASWKMTSWRPQNSIFDWRPGVVTITSRKPNDARWEQRVHLSAGWYHFTAELRARGVGTRNTGAALTMMQYWIGSRELHGDTDWQTVGFYLKVGRKGADLELACRLGGYAGLNVGSVSCRDIEGVRVAGPPPGAHHVFDLDALMARHARSPASAASTSNTTVLFVVAIALLLIIFSRDFLLRSAKNAPSTGAKRSETVSPRESKLGAGARTCAPITSPVGVREIEIALFVLAWLSFAYFYQAADQSTASRFDLIRALLEHHRLWIDGYAGFNTADIVQMHGHVYSNKAPGGALTGLVPWILVTGFLRLVMSPGPWFWALATYLTTVFSVSLIAAMGTVLVYRAALGFGASQGRAAGVALLLAFGTIMFPHATEFTAEPMAAFCVFAAFYIVEFHRQGKSIWPPLAAGLLAGWSVLCDYPTFVVAAVVGIFALWKLGDRRRIVAFCAGAGAIAVLLAVYDLIAFGNPFFLSYEAYMLPGSDRFAAQARGFAGVTYPHPSILWDVLFGAQRGLFFCNPVMLLAAAGLFYLWKRRRLRPEFIAIGSIIVGFILFNASYGNSVVYWGGGTATGPRHMISALPFMALALVFVPAGFDSMLWILGLLSAFMMLMATAIEPHLPYEYQNPFLHFLWPAFLRGDFGYNKSTYFGGGPIVGDSVAFNLGKLARLPRALQLWPLLGLWLSGGWWLMRRIGGPQFRGRRWPAMAAGAAALVAIFALPAVGSTLLRPNLNQTEGLLGKYYEGMNAGVYPPHIVRVDRTIDFHTLAQLGALPYPSCVLWSGSIYAPTSGTYRFVVAADDVGWLTIDRQVVVPDPGAVTKAIGEGSVRLDAGWHRITVGERNIWGGAYIRLSWEPPGGQAQIVPARDLRPGPGAQPSTALTSRIGGKASARMSPAALRSLRARAPNP
jgi:PA14 domain